MKLDIVMASDTLARAHRLQAMLSERLAGWDIRIGVLLIDNSGASIPANGGVDIFHRRRDWLPIHHSRNLCQRELQCRMLSRGSIGMVLDDDLVWTAQGKQFERHLADLKDAGCDMALVALTGDPPIPKEYTRASPLLDLLLHLADGGWRAATTPLPPALSLRAYLMRVNVVAQPAAGQIAHHDDYSFELDRFHRSRYHLPSDTDSLREFLVRLKLGRSTTRLVATPKRIEPASGRERGGATLVLNPQVLDVANSAVLASPLVGRRSDMVMALRAGQRGHRLMVVPPLLHHQREPPPSGRDQSKLRADILGYATVEAISTENTDCVQFHRLLEQRIARTRTILHHTGKMLRILQGLSTWMHSGNKSGIDELITSLRRETKHEDTQLAALDPDQITIAYRDWASPDHPAQRIHSITGL
jgi:hypothetical protein